MTKIPDVSWFRVEVDGVKHPTDARQDNMREVRNQLGGSAAAPAPAPDPHFTLKAALATCQCPYGWHAVHTDCHPAPFWPAEPVPQYDGWPIMGVGETLFSPEEIAHWRAEALRLYQEGMNEVQAANAARSPSQVNDAIRASLPAYSEYLKARERQYMPETTQPQSRRYLEGDTEFSDNDIEDYYRERQRLLP